MATPILQFGTGRFLQAHVDVFVSQALARGHALGRIAVVQTTNSTESSARLSAMASGRGFSVEVKGHRDGRPVAETVHVDSIGAAWHADRDWLRIVAAVAGEVQVIVSNTTEAGYALHEADDARLLSDTRAVPRSFPAKLAVLLHHRWRLNPEAELSLYPCELVVRNGDTLRELVFELAAAWRAEAGFLTYVRGHCVWLNSLVDRIVSAPLEPAGAIAEPFALWAIERRERMVLPCIHPAIVVTDDLHLHERLKLSLLNLGHSFLAERWLADHRRADETVFEAIHDAALRAELEAVWTEEVLPVFSAEGNGDDARAYLASLRERLLNPFLEHRLADIAHDHAQKKRRRFAPVIARASALNLTLPQERLRAALAGNQGGHP